MPESVFYQEMWSVLRLAVIFGFILLALKIVKGGKRQSRDAQAEETRTIQEIYHGLNGMERRVESLETLLLEKDKRE